jgi:Methyltransferase domain
VIFTISRSLVVTLWGNDLGLASAMVAAGAASVTAIDTRIDTQAREFSAETYGETVKVCEDNIYNIGAHAADADVLVCAYDFHSLMHPAKFLLEARKCIKNEGLLFIHTITWKDDLPGWGSNVFRFFDPHEPLLESPSPGLFDEAGLVSLFRNCGFDVWKKMYEIEGGPMEFVGASNFDQIRYGPLKHVGWTFKKCKIQSRHAVLDGSEPTFDPVRSNAGAEEMMYHLNLVLEKNSKTNKSIQELLGALSDREREISLLRSEIIDRTNEIDKLRAELLYIKAENQRKGA